MNPRFGPRAAWPIAAALLVLAGCAKSPRSITGAQPAPDATVQSVPGGSNLDLIRSMLHPGGTLPFRYPLDPGHTADYEVFIQTGVDTGDGPELGPAYYFQRNRTITCRQEDDGREYTAERWTETPGGMSWLLFRQDGAGLYERDAVLFSPPACEGGGAPDRATGEELARALERNWSTFAATRVTGNRSAWQAAWSRNLEKLSRMAEGAGRPPLALGVTRLPVPRPSEGELLRLAYPLLPGRSWIIREDPFFGARVDGVETLDLPAGRLRGYRIRMSSELYGPGDRVFVWYGTDGFLRMTAVASLPVLDDQGNPLGEMVAVLEERITLLGPAIAP